MGFTGTQSRPDKEAQCVVANIDGRIMVERGYGNVACTTKAAGLELMLGKRFSKGNVTHTCARAGAAGTSGRGAHPVRRGLLHRLVGVPPAPSHVGDPLPKLRPDGLGNRRLS